MGGVQEQGCWALTNLSVNNDNQAAITRERRRPRGDGSEDGAHVAVGRADTKLQSTGESRRQTSSRDCGRRRHPHSASSDDGTHGA